MTLLQAPYAAAATAVPADPEPPNPQPGPAAPTPDDDPEPKPTPGPTPRPADPGDDDEDAGGSGEREPTPGPTPHACEADGDPSDCDHSGGFNFGPLLDVPGMIVNAVTAFLGMLLEQLMKPIRELLADTLLSTPDVTEQGPIKAMWTGSMAIAAGIYVLFVTAGGITVMGYETVQSRYALKQILPRLLIGMVAAALSLTVIGKAIELANALSHAVMGTDMTDAGKGLVERVIPFALFGAPGLKLYLLLLAVVTVVLILAVLIGYIIRVAVIALLAVAAPLALACHAHPVTDGVARMWWRALAGCLTIQVAQSMTFVVALKMFYAPGATLLGFPKPSQLGTMLAGLALFWILFKIPGWCLRHVFHTGSSVFGPLGMVRSAVQWRLMSRAVSSVPGLGRGGGTGGSGGAGGPSSRGGPGGGGRPGGGRPWGGLLAGMVGGRAGRATAGAAAQVATGRGGRSHGASSAQAPRPGGATGAQGGGASTASGTRATKSSRTTATTPRPTPRRGRPGSGTKSAVPKALTAGPRSVPHPAAARRARQLALPIKVARVPAARPRAVQTRLPIPADRRPRAAQPAPASGAASPTPPAPTRISATRLAPAVRARQLALPIPATRVRLRPARPMQLRLPMEPPRS
ncbi:hypothetical protein [Streptomyces sp. N35]|uniref:hypothetical protein n=1 Tax=Streptomyces sp. N35 TaxID=2795730 RepID=UPI0027DC8040|nr:hypothetical protein [Streptomyces sp. N35]